MNNHLYRPIHKKMTLPRNKAIAVAEAEAVAVEIVAVIVRETNNTIIIMREEMMKTINRMRRTRDATIIRSITVISDSTTSLASMRMRAQSAEVEVAVVAVDEVAATTTMKMAEAEAIIEEAVVAIVQAEKKAARMPEETTVVKTEGAEEDAKTSMMILMANINLREEVGASATKKVNLNSKSRWLQKLVAVLRIVITTISPT